MPNAYALITKEELRRELAIDTTDKDDELDDAIDRATFEIEDFLGRDLISRGALTEYHTVPAGQSEIFTRVWPIITVTSAAEDTQRVYGTNLTVTTDYIIALPVGRITRVSGADRYNWQTGFRAIKLVYTGGYADTDAAPIAIKGVARHYAALIFREVMRKEQGISGIADSVGNFSRFGPVELTKSMKNRLWPHKASVHARTWERDA